MMDVNLFHDSLIYLHQCIQKTLAMETLESRLLNVGLFFFSHFPLSLHCFILKYFQYTAFIALCTFFYSNISILASGDAILLQ